MCIRDRLQGMKKSAQGRQSHICTRIKDQVKYSAFKEDLQMAYKRLKDNYTEEEYNQCVSAVTNYMNNAKNPHLDVVLEMIGIVKEGDKE